MRRLLVLCALVAFPTVACGARELPPVAAPTKEMPKVAGDVPTSPPVNGESRLVIDANGEKARVIEVVGVAQSFGYSNGYAVSAHSVMTRPVCAETPCVVDMSKGEHTLGFIAKDEASPPREEVVEVKVGDQPKVIRHAIGKTEHHALATVGGITTLLGVSSLALCWIPYLLASGTAYTPEDAQRQDSMQSLGQAMLIGGGVALAAGIVMLVAGRPDHTPGATTEWTDGAPPPASPAAFPVRSVGYTF